MATQIRVDFQSDGFQALLNDDSVKALLRDQAERIASAAGPGFEVQEAQGKYGNSPRPIVFVRARTTEAKRAQAEDGALERALYAGG